MRWKTSCSSMSAFGLIGIRCKSALHNMKLRTRCCDALVKLRQLFSIESATERCVELANKNQEASLAMTNVARTDAQHFAAAMHWRIHPKSVHQRRQTFCPKHPPTACLTVAHDFLSTQQLCTMATACTVPVTEMFRLLHERSKCLDARRKVPGTLVHQVMPMAQTGIQPRNWPRAAIEVWSNVRKWTWIAPLQSSSRKQFVKLRIRARNLGQHSIASQALRNVFMTMWFRSGQTVRDHTSRKPNVNTFGKKPQRCLRALRH